MAKLTSGNSPDLNGDGYVSDDERIEFERQRKRKELLENAKDKAQDLAKTENGKKAIGKALDGDFKGAGNAATKVAADKVGTVADGLGANVGSFAKMAHKAAKKLDDDDSTKDSSVKNGVESVANKADDVSDRLDDFASKAKTVSKLPGNATSAAGNALKQSLGSKTLGLLLSIGSGAKTLSYGVMVAAGDTIAVGASAFTALSGTMLGPVGTTVLLGGGAASGVAGVSYVVSDMTDAIAKHDEDPFDAGCTTGDTSSDSSDSSASSSADSLSSAEQLENAKKIYSVLSAWGLSDEQIAGVLGNGEVESSLNPKKVESDYTSAFKATGFEDADKNHDASVETLFNGGWSAFTAAYGSISLNEATYKGLGASDTDDGKHWPGIGIWQWTGVGARGLSKFAKANNMSIWSIDTQLTYLLSSVADDASYYSRLEKYKAMSVSSAADAGSKFAQYWEGNTSMAQSERQANATKWLVEIKKFDKDTSYANSILSKVKSSTSSSSSDSRSTDTASVVDCSDSSDESSTDNIDSGYLMKVNYAVTQGYVQYSPGGSYHHGVDITTPSGEGTDLYAAASGTVIVSDNTTDPAGAVVVVIKLDDGNGYLQYAHMVTGSNKPKVGDHLEKGDYVGKLGNTGNSLGAHLHFQYSPASNDRAQYLAVSAVPGGISSAEPVDSKYTQNPQPYLKGVDNPDDIDGSKHKVNVQIDVSK